MELQVFSIDRLRDKSVGSLSRAEFRPEKATRRERQWTTRFYDIHSVSRVFERARETREPMSKMLRNLRVRKVGTLFEQGNGNVSFIFSLSFTSDAPLEAALRSFAEQFDAPTVTETETEKERERERERKRVYTLIERPVTSILADYAEPFESRPMDE